MKEDLNSYERHVLSRMWGYLEYTVTFISIDGTPEKRILQEALNIIQNKLEKDMHK